MDFTEHFKNTLIAKRVSSEEENNPVNYQKRIQIYLVNNSDVLVKKYSKGSRVNAGLYDVGISANLNDDENFFDGLVRVYSDFTSQDIDKVNSNQNVNKGIHTPRVYVDHNLKIFNYIYFIKTDANISQKHILDLDVDKYEYINVNDFVKVFFSDKFKSYPDSYKEVVRLGLCDAFDVLEVKKLDRYHRISN